MKTSKKIIAGILACLMLMAAMAISVSAYGGDNDFSFTMNTKGNQACSYSSDTRYRGTTSTKTPWKVNFRVSSEGKKTIMQYFLAGDELFSKAKLSDYKNVTEGSGNKYFHAYDDACKRNVKLGVRNNNNTPYEYSVSGYWDEETAKHAFSD